VFVNNDGDQPAKSVPIRRAFNAHYVLDVRAAPESESYSDAQRAVTTALKRVPLLASMGTLWSAWD